MENEDTKNRQQQTADKLSTGTPKNKASKKTKKPENRDEKPKAKKKKTLHEYWKSATAFKKLEISVLTIGAATGIAILGVYIWQTLEARWNAHAQRMPLVINSQGPQFLQPFVCDVKNGFHTGNIQRAVKNIGNASAYHVMPYISTIKIVPEKKTGDAFIDELPHVNCRMEVKSNEMEMPLPPQREVFPQLRQMAGTIPPITKDDPIQLYWTSCVYYADEYGGNHGSCDTYRLMFPSTNPLDAISGSPTFFCDATPRTGKFQDTISGHCQE
jgi:hypothetical protein